jgi:hypothetical protein
MPSDPGGQRERNPMTIILKSDQFVGAYQAPGESQNDVADGGT